MTSALTFAKTVKMYQDKDYAYYSIYSNLHENLPGVLPLHLSAFVAYDYANIDSHDVRTISLADIKLQVSKCLAGNLCRLRTGRKIGRKSHKERCAVYELLNMYRALSNPCITDEQAYTIQCAINGYCFCDDNCGCSKPLPLPTPTITTVDGVRTVSFTPSWASKGLPPCGEKYTLLVELYNTVAMGIPHLYGVYVCRCRIICNLYGYRLWYITTYNY